MKRTVLPIVLLGIVCLSYAGNYYPNRQWAIPIAIGSSKQNISKDSSGTPASFTHVNSEIPSIPEMFSQLLLITGTTNEFELRAANVMNLEASISHKKKLIRYNPAFIESLNNATGDKWACLTLLAHEIGHHMKGHTRHRAKDRINAELQADEYAGAILAKLGASLDDAQKVMLFVAKPTASTTHPDRYSRMDAIARGWSSIK